MSNNIHSHLLHLFNSLIISIDLENKNIETVLDCENEIATNITYDEFSDMFQAMLNLTQESRNKILRFIQNLNPSGEPFTIRAKYNTMANDIVRIICKGYMHHEHKVLITFSKADSETHDEYDSLTKIYTMLGIRPKFEEAIASGKPFTLMVIDLDDFDTFNEKYGIMYGDIVLVEAAASIKKYLKSNGYVGRIGGDKFIVLNYIENNYDYIHQSCTNIRRAISNLQNHNIKQASIKATLGCASFPNDGEDFDILYKKAYVALNRGKKKGRDCFIIYDVNKCGAVDNIEIKQIESNSEHQGIASQFNIIAGIFEIIHRSGSKLKNIDDSLTLIGNYFLLDRVTLMVFNPDKKNVSRIHTWNNPRIQTEHVRVKEECMDLWDKTFDKTGMIKIFQTESNKNLPIYPMLKEAGTTSIIAFSLKYMERNLGTITFDMVQSNKFWSDAEVSALMVISKIFTIYLNKEYENMLHIRALSYDRLTNIYNYSKWRDSVYEFVAEARNPNDYSIIYFNIEGFMHLNDLLGTAICDQALTNIGNGLRFVSRNEIFCRVSDDKFLVFLPTRDENQIKKYIADLDYYLVENYPYGKRFKLVCGVYIHNEITDNLTTAIDKANLARKQPRITEEGIRFFSSDLYEDQTRRLKLERHMFEAKDNGEFLLYLQPKVNTLTGKVVGAEALTRWNFMGTKILTPNFFIPLFEQNGFINELDLIVFENVCKFQRDIIDNGLTPITISLNVSRYQKDFDSYIDNINNIRKRYDISPKLIEIEITEGMYIDNVELISALMKRLHENGYSISMDDFGAGYSNLSSLASLDFDTIKLDRNFCSNKEGKREKIILSFVMALAKNLDVDVLCEGVETKELIDFLQSIGCNLVQGFYYDRPIPAQEFKNKYLVS